MYVCHNCPGGDNPACINPAHLWLGTNADNLRDMDAKGRRVNRRGERHYRARLTDENVRAIRQHRAEGWSYRRIAAEFDIAPGNAHRIATYQQWKHVT
jgi:DNA-directed RNA polymerase specialized sigma24 family protein